VSGPWPEDPNEKPAQPSARGSCLGIIVLGGMSAILMLAGLAGDGFAFLLGALLGFAAGVLGIMWLIKHGNMKIGI